MSIRGSLSRPLATAVATIALLGLFASDASALLIRNYSQSKHTRTGSSFIGAAYDFSGVALSGQITMLTRTWFYGANHLQPNGNKQFRDSNGTLYVRGVDSTAGARVTGTDIWIGKLTSPVPSTINPLPILWMSSYSDYVGLEFFMYGGSDVVGRNEVWRVGTRSGAAGTILESLYDNPGLGDDEATGIPGDSSRPSLTVVNGSLALLGSHYYMLQDEDLNPAGTGDTFARAYIDEINTIMGSENVTLTFIPEPTTLGLFGAGLLGVFLLRRRRRAA